MLKYLFFFLSFSLIATEGEYDENLKKLLSEKGITNISDETLKFVHEFYTENYVEPAEARVGKINMEKNFLYKDKEKLAADIEASNERLAEKDRIIEAQNKRAAEKDNIIGEQIVEIRVLKTNCEQFGKQVKESADWEFKYQMEKRENDKNKNSFWTRLKLERLFLAAW